MDNQTLKVLHVTSSARQQDSVTRRFSNQVLSSLQDNYDNIQVVERNVSSGIPFIDEQWVNANFTENTQRSKEQQDILSYSDELVAELQNADAIIISSPIYNFSVPATLKAWIDQIARVGLTFNYTADGPEGKLKNKKAYIVMASGGTELGSDVDFASGYLRHILGFIGINDVSTISAERFNHNDEQALENINTQIKAVTRKAA